MATLQTFQHRNETVTSAPGGAKAPASEARSLGDTSAGAPVVVSGNDYSRGSLEQIGSVAMPPAAGAEGVPLRRDSAATPSPGVAGYGAPNVPGPLQRLVEPAARARCLNAVVREYGGRVALVDFARFEGRPALVVALDDAPLGGGKRLVVVVGPACGQDTALTDERYRSTVG